RRNLKALGFPLPAAPPDLLLTEGERPEWEGDKVDRRRHVAEGHRILLLVGDNLGDFTAEPQPGEYVRDRAAARPLATPAPGPGVGDRWWGRRWIVIPNPVYGSWEDAVLESDRE
ncbi:MAG: HAD family acid phosphatase, partial [Gemmatimonadota bacterium]